MFTKKIGIDLGTANTLVYVPKRGIVLNEPSVVAVTLDDNRILAVGLEAKQMLGRTPETITAVCPMKDGVIADYRITEAMLRYLINKVTGGIRFFKPEVMISVPAGITSTERRAVIEAAVSAGAKIAYLIKEPVAAAIGAGIPIGEPAGHMIVDIGGGTSEVAVISLGGVVAVSSVRIAGNRLDQAILDSIRKRHSLIIGERTAEEIKIKIGSAISLEDEKIMAIRGRDMASGLPRTIEITSSEVSEAMQEDLKEIVQTAKNVLQNTPPELSADIIDKGMILTGGGALLRNIDKLITKMTGVPSYVADDPMLCVVKGTGAALENLKTYKQSISAAK